MKTFYTVLFALILAGILGCDPIECLYFATGTTFKVCVKYEGGVYSHSVEQYNSFDDDAKLVSGPVFNQTPCDVPPTSDAEPQSAAPVPTRASASPSASRAASVTDPAPYVPQPTLQLPFAPLPSSRDQANNDTNCAGLPDVLHVAHLTGEVVRFRSCPLAVSTRISVASRPLQVQITPDGTTALVTSFDNAVSFIDLQTNRVTFTLQTPSTIRPNGLAITPDGTKFYITSYSPSNPAVQLYDLQSHALLATIPTPAYPQSAFLSPDGSQLWVTFPLGQTVYVIDTLTNSLATVVGVPQAYGLAFNSTGTLAYITSWGGGTGSVKVVDTATFLVTGSYPVGAGPVDISAVYGDRLLLVGSRLDGSVSAINVGTGRVKTFNKGGPVLGLTVLR